MGENSELEYLSAELLKVMQEEQKAQNELSVLKDRESELRRRIACLTPPPPKRRVQTSESFVGENILGKIGIIIIVIGLIALLKYLFDRGFLSTFGKVAAGYIMSAAAVFFAWKNKDKRKILASILLTGGISLSYSLTFVSQHYFEIFPQMTALTISLMIAVFACVAGYFYSNVLFGFSVLTVFFAPTFAGLYLNENTFWGWTVFTFVLVGISCAFSFYKKTRVGINAAFVVAVFFILEVFLDAPDYSRSFWLYFITFSLFYTADILLQQSLKKDFSIIFNLVNTLFAMFCFAVVSKEGFHSAYYDFILTVWFLISVLVFKQSYKNLILALLTLDFGVFLILLEHHQVHLTALIFATEAILFLLIYKKTAQDFFEKISFNLNFISIFSAATVLIFYTGGHYKPVVNSAFFTMMILTCVYFLLYVNYDRKTYSSYSQLFVFIMVIAAAELETAFYPEFSHPLLLSLLAAVYALGVFVFGAKKDSPLLRRFAIVLAIMTAVKIILCDVSENSLAMKAVVFITEGGIFLLFSYLYSKYLKK